LDKLEVTFNQHLAIFSNFVPDEWCNNLTDIFLNNQNKSFKRKTSSSQGNIQDTQLYIDDLYPELVKQFCNNFHKPLKKYIDKYNLDQYSNFYIQGFKYQQTKIHEGFHPWHCENLAPSLTNRTLVYTLYLNDVEEGGETEFLYQSLRIKPKKGLLCIFPASFTHLHRGNPPYSNTKHILTGWVNYTKYPEKNSPINFSDLQKNNVGLSYPEQIFPL